MTRSELISEIQSALEEEQAAFQDLFSASTRAGMFLIAAQKRIPKDKWKAWLKKNLDLTPKRARECIKDFTDMSPEDQEEWRAEAFELPIELPIDGRPA